MTELTIRVPAEAVDAAYKVYWMNGRSVEKMLEAAAPFIAAQALRRAADNLEIRMDQSDPGSYAEQQYQAGYADAVARLILQAEGKA